jgi:uncharacterized protein YaiI (UPF0178 family)
MIYVDADACPVKAEVDRVATRHRHPVTMVSNGGIRPSANPLIVNVIVEHGADVADQWIAARAGPGDVVVTGDLPLAARVIAGGAVAIRHDGTVWDDRNIGPALAARDLAADLRAADPFRAGGGRPFSATDRSRFLDRLEVILRKLPAKGG